MTIKRSGLGRNLSALLGTTTNAVISPSTPTEKSSEAISQIPIHILQPGKYQPRGEMDENALNELAASIKQQGLLQPVIVRQKEPQSYEILAGERRWRASQLAGLSQIPVIIKQVDDQTAMAIALIENLQREDLNPMDQARAMQRLSTEFDLTHQQIAELLNKSRTAVSNFLRLLSLSAETRRLLENGDLDMGHARALLALEEHQQTEVARQVVARELSVRETEQLVNRIKKGLPLEKKREESPILFSDEINQLAQKLKTQIALKQGKNGNGTLVIHYKNTYNLQTLLNQLQIVEYEN